MFLSFHLWCCSEWWLHIPCNDNSLSQDSKGTLEYFGFGLEMIHLWAFLSMFAIGAASLWLADAYSMEELKKNSLKLTCALYAMETSLFSLLRFFTGVSKPLVCKFKEFIVLWVQVHEFQLQEVAAGHNFQSQRYVSTIVPEKPEVFWVTKSCRFEMLLGWPFHLCNHCH